MSRVFFIFIFIFVTGNLFGQVANATVSATIVTPVGAEISGGINDANFLLMRSEKFSDISKEIENEKNNSFLKIIGEIFSHHVIVEKGYVPVRSKENEQTLSARKHESFISITVNFD